MSGAYPPPPVHTTAPRKARPLSEIVQDWRPQCHQRPQGVGPLRDLGVAYRSHGSAPAAVSSFEDYTMRTAKSPDARAAHGASVSSDQLAGRVTSEANRQPSVTQAPTPATLVGTDRCSREDARSGYISPSGQAGTAPPTGLAQRRTSRAADPQTRVGSPQQRCADAANAREFQRIQTFAAACRRQWPGAVIVLRPNQGGAPAGAQYAAYSTDHGSVSGI